VPVKTGRLLRILLLVLTAGACSAFAAYGSPWAQVGDAQLRSDIELLANAGVLDNITTEWPLPWAGILSRLRGNSLADQPDYIRAAAERVLAEGLAQTQPGFGASLSADGTNDPSVIRGFDALGREDGEGQLSGDFIGQSTAIGLSLGAQIDHGTHRTQFLPDGSYAVQAIGGAFVYAGYLTHWWGPGWISALSLSNNARPFPQVGIERRSTQAFSSPWLSWMGPWQMEFFVGLLDGPRVDRNTIYNGLRLVINPLPGLEIAGARTEEVCGEHHECDPISEYFEFSNDKNNPNHTNDEGNIDVRYTNAIFGLPFEVYTQLMNEDSNPLLHSDTSHLYGGSLWVPLAGSPARLTVEYTDTVPTVDIFSFGDLAHGTAYNNYDYVDGMRYRGRSLGFSLDSDSRLLSVQGSWVAQNGFTYTLTYDHADVSTPELEALTANAPSFYNAVTTAPVKFDMGVARLTMPFKGIRIDLEGRIQSDQPRPAHGMTGAVELAFTIDM
jgi:Capsule assembly protein Wzi